ncbi:MAG: 3-methyladenine DNA glycosylase Mpg, partial [Limisphaerales bacterium]
PPVPNEEIMTAKRIGLGVKAGEWAERPWRFYRKDSLFVTPG